MQGQVPQSKFLPVSSPFQPPGHLASLWDPEALQPVLKTCNLAQYLPGHWVLLGTAGRGPENSSQAAQPWGFRVFPGGHQL